MVLSVPRLGASGIATRPANHAFPSRIGQETMAGSANSSLSTPKSRSTALAPSPKGSMASSSIATESPGRAPRTAMGPVTGARGCPSDAGVKGVGTRAMSSMSSKAPSTVTSISAPGSTVIAGGVAGLRVKR